MKNDLSDVSEAWKKLKDLIPWSRCGVLRPVCEYFGTSLELYKQILVNQFKLVIYRLEILTVKYILSSELNQSLSFAIANTCNLKCQNKCTCVINQRKALWDSTLASSWMSMFTCYHRTSQIEQPDSNKKKWDH